MDNKARGTDGKFKTNSTADISVQDKKKKVNTRYLREKDREEVRGVFNYYETKNGTLKFSYKKYKGDPVDYYELVDGQVYSLPRGVAKHLNTSGAYRTHEYALTENGKQVQKIGIPIRKYGFQSLEFTTFDDNETINDKKIITVESV